MSLSSVRRTALIEYDAGYRDIRIAGMDEAGRGALAGPVVAACVGIPPVVPGVDDSKKLTPERRARLYDAILREAWFVGVGMADVDEIESLNILGATRLAMSRAAQGLACHLLLVDALESLAVSVKQIGIPHGDATSYAIAAASIVAKVTRDRLMIALDDTAPGYGFARHKGYGTQAHYEALQRLGPSAFHRPSFLHLAS